MEYVGELCTRQMAEERVSVGQTQAALVFTRYQT